MINSNLDQGLEIESQGHVNTWVLAGSRKVIGLKPSDQNDKGVTFRLGRNVTAVAWFFVPASQALAQQSSRQISFNDTIPFLVMAAMAVGIAFAYLYKHYRALKQVNQRYEVRKREQELILMSLLEADKRYQLVTEMSPTGIYLTDPEGRCIYANRQWCQLAGLSLEEALGSGWESAIHPEDRERIGEGWCETVENRRHWEDEYRFLHPDGKVTWVWGQARPLIDGEKELLGYIGSNTDITRIKEAESATRFSEAKYRAVVQSAALGIVSLDERGYILSVNPAFTEISGYDERSLNDRRLRELLSSDHRDGFEAEFNGLLSATRKKRVQMTAALRCRDGDLCTLSITLSKPCDQQSGCEEQVIAVIEDVTERLLLEEEISHAEKLESVGLLAGGIAHDFNNILTGIIGNLSLAEADTPKDSETYELITEAQKSAQRAQKLTQRLLTFSKGGTPVKKTMPLDDVVRDAALFALHGSDVKCEFEIDADLDFVNIDEGQMAQVIHNLVMNADQAMPRGGTITVKVSNHRVTEDDSDSALQPGHYVRVDISDHGVGIPKDYLKKIFDPFFSTKERGSGLGLSTSYSIIRKHDGHIKVSSAVGRGSKFSIYLPTAEEPDQPADSDSRVTVETRGKILVMDDEQTVRQVVHLTLKKLGYDVFEAVDGEDAIKKYRHEIESGNSFKAVLLDLTIPGGKGGQATLEELKLIDSDVKAIVMSGYSNDPVLSDFRAYGFCGMISKPFSYSEISEAVSLAITGQGTSFLP